MKFWLYLLSIALVTTTLAADYPHFDNNTNITRKERAALHDCLIPLDHPIKPILDNIFTSSRVTLNQQTLEQAGFQILKNQPRSFILVVKHESLPGYLIKLYLDKEKRKKRGKPGWYWFSKRIHAVREIEKCIQDNHLVYYKTPQKWVYPIPLFNNKSSKNFILVVEDMHLLSDSDNRFAWKNWVTKTHLDELVLILKKCGGDSISPRNVPFCHDGKIAFIDTEYPGKKTKFSMLTHSLSQDMQAYWRKITR